MNDNDKQQGPDNDGGGNPWMKSLMIWVGILVALALVVSLLDGRTAQPSGNTIAYSQFLDKVEEGTVKEVNVAGEVITGTLKDDSAFRTYAIQEDRKSTRLNSSH